jgi:hypothetical protein
MVLQRKSDEKINAKPKEHSTAIFLKCGELLWLSGKVVKNEKINEIERTRVRSPPTPGNLYL